MWHFEECLIDELILIVESYLDLREQVMLSLVSFRQRYKEEQRWLRRTEETYPGLLEEFQTEHGLDYQAPWNIREPDGDRKQYHLMMCIDTTTRLGFSDDLECIIYLHLRWTRLDYTVYDRMSDYGLAEALVYTCFILPPRTEDVITIIKSRRVRRHAAYPRLAELVIGLNYILTADQLNAIPDKYSNTLFRCMIEYPPLALHYITVPGIDLTRCDKKGCSIAEWVVKYMLESEYPRGDELLIAILQRLPVVKKIRRGQRTLMYELNMIKEESPTLAVVKRILQQYEPCPVLVKKQFSNLLCIS